MSNKDCHRRRLAAVCGRYCGTCSRFVAEGCCGCAYTLGETSQGTCDLYCCCIIERGLEHCGVCLDFPCRLFMSHGDPAEVARHYRALCRRAQIGTSAWLDEQESQAL